MRGFSGKGIFFGNIKGGVGKSTLCMFTLDMLRKLKPDLKVLLIDIDPQATAAKMMQNVLPDGAVRAMPITDNFDGTALSMIDGVMKTHLVEDNSLVIIDSAAGNIGNVWQVAMLCNAMVIPTSMSWVDMAPTIEYITEIDSRKIEYDSKLPHLIVVPNRNAPNQKNYAPLYDKAAELNVVLAPPVSDFAVVRHTSHNFKGLESVENSRFYGEIEKMAQFIVSHVLTGKLDEIYDV